jgi:AraC-like DNA-binding protein
MGRSRAIRMGTENSWSSGTDDRLVSSVASPGLSRAARVSKRSCDIELRGPVVYDRNGMIVRRNAAGVLAQFIDVLWWSHNDHAGYLRERALPTGAMTLVINLGDQPIRIFRDEEDQTGFSFRHSVVWGPQTRYAVRDSTRTGAVVGVQFRPGMAGAVLGIAASELTDSFASLEDLWGRSAAELRDQILEAATAPEQIAAAQRMLTPVHRPLLVHPAVAYALRELDKPEVPSVEDVRHRTGYGAKRFIELFAAATGITPKHYSRLRRFQHVLAMADRRAEKPDWAQIAAAGGYADQAHLAHEFKAFSGITPGAYRPVETGRQCHVAIPE